MQSLSSQRANQIAVWGDLNSEISNYLCCYSRQKINQFHCFKDGQTGKKASTTLNTRIDKNIPVSSTRYLAT